jgi:ABC-type Fe3+/spermidine/putrescine transport system ATPase subunit
VATEFGEILCAYKELMPENSRVTLAVRPESIDLQPSGQEPPGVNVIKSRIKERTYLGSILDYKIVCGNDSVMRVQEDPWTRFEVGEEINVCFPPDRIWIIQEEEESAPGDTNVRKLA